MKKVKKAEQLKKLIVDKPIVFRISRNEDRSLSINFDDRYKKMLADLDLDANDFEIQYDERTRANFNFVLDYNQEDQITRKVEVRQVKFSPELKKMIIEMGDNYSLPKES